MDGATVNRLDCNLTICPILHWSRDHPRDVYPGRRIALVLEVSDSTITYDRTVKLPLYAGVGIPEAWIVNLNEDTVEVHTNPSPQGYKSTSRFGRGSRVVSATIPGPPLQPGSL